MIQSSQFSPLNERHQSSDIGHSSRPKSFQASDQEISDDEETQKSPGMSDALFGNFSPRCCQNEVINAPATSLENPLPSPKNISNSDIDKGEPGQFPETQKNLSSFVPFEMSDSSSHNNDESQQPPFHLNDPLMDLPRQPAAQPTSQNFVPNNFPESNTNSPIKPKPKSPAPNLTKTTSPPMDCGQVSSFPSSSSSIFELMFPPDFENSIPLQMKVAHAQRRARKLQKKKFKHKKNTHISQPLTSQTNLDQPSPKSFNLNHLRITSKDVISLAIVMGLSFDGSTE